MNRLIQKLFNKETVTYVLFGALTTVVNFLFSWLLKKTPIHDLVNVVLSWIAAVSFAFVTNKLFVFKSRRVGAVNLLRELAGFFGARLLSLGFEELFMLIAVTLLGMNFYSGKIIAAIFVILMNYFASKFFIFNKKIPLNEQGGTDRRE